MVRLYQRVVLVGPFQVHGGATPPSGLSQPFRSSTMPQPLFAWKLLALTVISTALTGLITLPIPSS